MKIEIGTEKLKEAVSKVFKGAGSAGILVITTIIGIEGKDGNLTLSATDTNANIKYTIKDCISKELNFYTNTVADTFKKLVDRTQSATVVLDIQDNKIVYSGSGDANLQIVMNSEDGESVPAKIQNFIVEGEPVDIKISDLKKFSTYLKATLPTSVNNPIYLNYRVFNNKAMSFDTFSSNLVEIGWDADILIPANIANLFETLSGDTAKVVVADNKIKLYTDTVEITGNLRANPEEYTTERFTRIIYNDELYGKVVTVDRARVINALDRIKLFAVGENQGIMSFEVDGKSLMFITLNNNCVENVALDTCTSDKIIVSHMGIEQFEKALSAVRSEKVTIGFADKGALRIVDETDKAYLVVPYARPKN